MRKSPLRIMRYALEAALVYPLYVLAWLLPLPAASALGGRLGDVMRVLHSGTARARRNLQLAMPERADEHEAIVREVWRNMGRVLLEYPHLSRLYDGGYITAHGVERLQLDTSKPSVFVGIHQANWEVGPLLAARQGWKLAAIYRPLNNVFVDPLLRFVRRANGQSLHTKSAEGATALLRHLRGGGSAALLIDQRLGDGIEVPFFGQPVLAPPMAALAAVKFGARLVPVQIVRNGGCRFTLTVHDAPPIPTEGTDAQKAAALTAILYAMFEGWIRQNPGQWLWTHDRWRPRGGWPATDANQ